MRRLSVFVMLLLMALLITEVFLRSIFGFCDAVLIKEDKDLEYITVPEQNRLRFGNHIFYNKYSMRSPELSDADSVRILGLGDSVINGGATTDQDSIATTIISRVLTHILGKRTIMMNISAGSWGPDNLAVYLKKFGDFNSKLMVLVVSSHDAHDNMQFDKVVDVSPNYPSRQYPLAIFELWDRYLWPRYIKGRFVRQETANEPDINKHGTTFNSGFSYLLSYSQAHRIPLIMYLHPEISEVTAKQYNDQGMEIIAFCKKNRIPLILGLNKATSASDYFDRIHLNVKGQGTLAKQLIPYVLQSLRKRNEPLNNLGIMAKQDSH